ncbi:NAD(P)/FAD-dependent oxidoreductase [Candidatus Micrarchaeota archaeon]|nr:NAD(P)/FAD-dependent oxidoreductase [Candidatus Micrarchaeota archaeon]
MPSAPYDVIVSGAGPAGSTCAFFLAKAGRSVLLLDRATFPRDKICADNKSWICTDLVKEMGLWNAFQRLPKQEIHAMLFSTPGGHQLRVPLETAKIKRHGPHYDVRRKLFDHMLFKAAKKQRTVRTMEGFSVQGVIREGRRVVGVKGTDGRGNLESFFAAVVVGADGSQSPVARTAGLEPVVPERHASNARAYFKGVVHDAYTVELHYLAGVNPGYFWIFPVDGGVCNVGVGLPTAHVRKNRLDPKKMLLELTNLPQFKGRFAKARRISDIGVWGVTVGSSKKKAVSGEGFVLVGDAANAAVTFAGEGCGPAMRSGKIAAESIDAALRAGDVSARSLHRYDAALWRVIGPENKAMGSLEFLIKNPPLFDFAVKRSAKNPKLAELASKIASDYRHAAQLWEPGTILSMLLG